VIASRSYANGSLLLHTGEGISDEFILYCGCTRPPVLSKWTWRTAIRCAVSKTAYARGFGTPQEIVPLSKRAIRRDT